jgi:hypothetical protein
MAGRAQRSRHRCDHRLSCDGLVGVKRMTVREEIAFSIFVAAAVVMGWKLLMSTLDYVLT